MMKVQSLGMAGVYFFVPERNFDERGYFFEAYNRKIFEEHGLIFFPWLDTGTVDFLRGAGEFVSVLERRQRLKICCPEKIALRSNFITAAGIEPWLRELGRNTYTDYVRKVAGSLPAIEPVAHSK
jgi:hypothetical protein